MHRHAGANYSRSGWANGDYLLGSKQGSRPRVIRMASSHAPGCVACQSTRGLRVTVSHLTPSLQPSFR
ncbi:hypothetical protein PISMIDRAFT_674207 [Pisolithus microcarpus 441]|uniref:Uncharacterized protein n=1 Tax=Pisolithus microcarpus 441 TaxID=765257 RepID=A0A0D0A0C5_9AGAM|nr:hypothetical protein PISMIDRAFT_674207 [Pisolithus microcarpus 441]